MCKKILTLIKFNLCAIICCNTFCNTKNDVIIQLEQVENQLTQNCDSNANAIFQTITQPEDTTYELAFYNYILTRLTCRNNKILPPETLDLPIKYFNDNKDYKRLAYAFDYKSYLLLYYSSDKVNALVFNNRAEGIAKTINDNLLNYNIYSNKSYIAMYYFDTHECLNSSLKALKAAQDLDDEQRIAHSSLILAMCYNEQKDYKNAEKYIDKCLNFIDSFNDVAQSMVYNTLGNITEYKDLDLAISYYKKSLSIYDNSDAYNNLALIYLQQGKINQSEEFFQKSLRPQAFESNINILKIYAEKLSLIGNDSKVLEVYKLLSCQKDSLINIKENNYDINIKKYSELLDHYEHQIDYLNKKLTKCICIILCLILISLILSILFITVKRQKEKELIIKQQYVSRGESCYQEIKHNNCISQWSKEDRELFVSYYKAKFPEYKTEVINIYNKLPTNSEIVLILHNMGKTKQEILDIMGFSDQAFRSLKSRTEKLKKNNLYTKGIS